MHRVTALPHFVRRASSLATIRVCRCFRGAIAWPLLLAVTALALACWPGGRSAAQPGPDDARARARQLGEQGIEAYWAKDYRSAEEKLDKAYQLFAVPTLGLWSARARASMGHLVEAAERYRDTARASDAIGDTTAQKEAQRSAAEELSVLLPRIPTLTIQLGDVPPGAVAVSIDGVVLESAMIGARRPSNPGEHRIEAVLGAEHQTLAVLLTEGQHVEKSFQLHKLTGPPSPSASKDHPPSQTARLESEANSQPSAAASKSSGDEPATASTKRLLGHLREQPLVVVPVALGAAGLLTSAITALSARAKCSDAVCRNESDRDRYESLRTASAVTFYLGATFAVGGVVAYFVIPKLKRSEQLGLRIGPGGVAMHGTF